MSKKKNPARQLRESDIRRIKKDAADFNLERVAEMEKKTDKQKEKLKQMLKTEREKVKGYEQIAQVHSAYISILLKRFGATEENKVDIQAKEVTEALSRYEARAEAIEGGFALYYTEPLEGEKTE